MIHRRNVCRVVVTFSSGSDDDMDDDDDDSDEQLRQNNNNVAVGAGGRQRRQQHREKRISVDDSVSKKAGKCTTTQHYTVRTNEHPFNGPFSGTTRVSRYQKGKTNLDFTEARDSEWQWHQLGHMQVCISLQTDNHNNTHHSVFYRPDALPAAQPTASKH